tara:strand:+ start:2279 stop:4081 length:1803 start_codon:yes stop_codon:yes gene_type:complete
MSKLKLILLLFSISNISLSQQNIDENMAKDYFNSNSYNKAKEIYYNLYTKNKIYKFYEKLLDCYINLNELDNAERLCLKYYKLKKNNTTVLVDLGHIYNLKDQTKKSSKIFDEVINIIQNNFQRINLIANRFKKYNYLELTLKVYQITLQKTKRSNLRYHIARIYGDMGKLDLMYENYIRLIISNKEYLQNVKNIFKRTTTEDSESENNIILKEKLISISLNHDNIDVFNILIWLYIQEKNFLAAFELMKSLDLKNNLNQNEIFDLGKICLENDDYDNAIMCFNYYRDEGRNSDFFYEANFLKLKTKYEKLKDENFLNKDLWIKLESEYIETIKTIGENKNSVFIMKNLAEIQAFYIHNIENATNTIKKTLSIPNIKNESLATCKILLGDILLLDNKIWEAIIIYSQVQNSFRNDKIGHLAKFKRAKISYYNGEFEWAQAQLDVLKKSTSKLIANDAMHLSLLIQDNLNLDTTNVTMSLFSKADLLFFQNKLFDSFNILDSIIINYPNHSLVDEALFLQHKIRVKEKKYKNAIEILDQIITFYPYDIIADDALFAKAKIAENFLKDYELAILVYEKIITDYDDSFFITESKKRYRILNEY